MAEVKRLVFDILKPHEPSIIEVCSELADLPAVDGVNAGLVETDKEVQNIKLTVEGADLSYDELERRVDELGGTVHSIDEAACGERLVEESVTPQG